MANRFLIQIRKNNVSPQIALARIMNSAGGASDWVTYIHSYNRYEDAAKECELLIKGRSHDADDIRIVEVVGTFESTISVKAKSDKYD